MSVTAKFILEISITETNDIESFVNKQNSQCDIIGLNFSSIENIELAKSSLKKILPKINKPLMIRGGSDEDFNQKLLPELIKILPPKSIIAHVNETNYKTLIPYAIKGDHTIVIRTPIDINLCKEMNILSNDIGQPLDKILIDTDIGGLGYGLEYGYSIMEKIKLESKQDKFLNPPLISFVIDETSKTKEARDKSLAIYLEITSASAVLAAGADYVVFNTIEALETLKGL
ncbi:MAG: hypothetical protein R3Y28_00905 [Candidatus Gastranaerophilales bacterium]